MKIKDFDLVRVGENDLKLIKFIYMCQINEDEKNMTTVQPIVNGTIEFDEKKFQEFIPNFQKVLKTSRIFYLLKQIDKLLGFIQLSDYNPRNQSVSIGFYFPKENRRKGFGKILLKLFLSTAFSEDYFWEINKVYGETCEINIGSKKLFESLGFHLDGIMREDYWFGEEKYNQLVYSILKAEFNR